MSDKKKILFVDDEKELVELVAIQLQAQGYEVISAYDGNEALKKAKEMPDFILLDLMMPGLSGYQVCEKLKKDPRFKHIPIVILSAKVSSSDQKEALRCGADDYIVKPFESKNLKEVIGTWLQKKIAV